MIQKRDRRQHHGMIAIAAPDVRNLVRPGPESLAEQLVLPLPSLPYRFGTIRRLKRPLYCFVFRFARYGAHAFLRLSKLEMIPVNTISFIVAPATPGQASSTACRPKKEVIFHSIFFPRF